VLLTKLPDIQGGLRDGSPPLGSSGNALVGVWRTPGNPKYRPGPA